MPRTAKASPEAIARACSKLQVQGRLTLANLCEELGGGGIEYLTRQLRAWRAQERAATRTPLANVVSDGLRLALSEQMQQVRDEMRLEMGGTHAEDQQHLIDTLDELGRVEQALDRLHSDHAAVQRELQTACASLKEAQQTHAEAIDEQRRRADRLAEQHLVLQRQHQDTVAELAVARQQRETAEQALTGERQQRSVLQARQLDETTRQAELASDLAVAQERCTQQGETLAYFRGDLKRKSDEVAVLGRETSALRGALAAAGQRAAVSEALVQEIRAASVKLPEPPPVRPVRNFKVKKPQPKPPTHVSSATPART